MKISKLFHWLYGFLMLLPVFAVAVTCGYVIFNKNAKDSYAISENGTITNSVIFNTFEDLTTKQVLYSDLVIGSNILENVNVNIPSATRFNVTFYLPFNNGNFTNNINNTTYTLGSNIAYLTLIIKSTSNTSYEFTLKSQTFDNATYTIYSTYTNLSDFNLVFSFDCLCTSSNIFCQRSKVNSSFCVFDTTLVNALQNDFTYSYVEEVLQRDNYLNNVFYTSLDNIKEQPIFSWANNSFLSTPILYITNLFNMPSNHVAITLMSYWLNISIIWLVFDLIMYVPLLVHRWLDKGVLE